MALLLFDKHLNALVEPQREVQQRLDQIINNTGDMPIERLNETQTQTRALKVAALRALKELQADPSQSNAGANAALKRIGGDGPKTVSALQLALFNAESKGNVYFRSTLTLVKSLTTVFYSETVQDQFIGPDGQFFTVETGFLRTVNAVPAAIADPWRTSAAVTEFRDALDFGT